MRATSGRAAGERGAASIWVLACCAVLLVVTGVVTVRTLAVLARHRAEAAADLAALAGAGRIGAVGSPCVAAADLAARNGARLRSCRVTVDADGRSGRIDVTVTIRMRLPLVGGRTVLADARAARRPP